VDRRHVRLRLSGGDIGAGTGTVAGAIAGHILWGAVIGAAAGSLGGFLYGQHEDAKKQSYQEGDEAGKRAQ
jgi:hypothetical protein